MNKTVKAILITLMIIIPALCMAQQPEAKISDNDWDKLVDLLKNEKWSSGEKLCTQYLVRYTPQTDTEADAAIIRYMYLRCIGAQLGEKKYSKEESLKKVKMLIGKTVITPPNEFRIKGLFNCFNLTDDNKNINSCGSNGDNTIIQTFETYQMADTNLVKTPALLENKHLRIEGTIKSIEAGGYAMPRLEVIIEKSFIWEEE